MAKRDKNERKNRKTAAKSKKPTSKKMRTAASTSKDKWLMPLLIVLGITALLYLPTLSYDYVNWDDDVNILENKNLEGDITGQTFVDIFSLEKGAVIGNYNPLPIVTFAIEKKLNGAFSPGLTHAGNLLFHLLCIFFVFKLCLQLGLNNWGAFVAALLFGIHPMRVESVTWATERKDVLFAMFFFWALTYYVRWLKAEKSGENRSSLYIIMVLLAILSLFSKVQAVALPLAMLAIDYWYDRELSFKRILEKWPFWLLSLCFGLINIYTLSQNASLDDNVTGYAFYHRILVGLYAFCIYMYKLVLPIPMSPLYPYPKVLPVMMYVTPFIFAAIWFAVYRLYKAKQKALVFGMLFFFFNVVFMLQILGAGQGFQADRFTYVPYFGLFFIMAYYFEKYYKQPKTKSMATGVAVAFFALCAVLTFQQNKIWENGGTLWTHVIEQEGKTVETPWGNRAYFYREQGNYEKALADYNVAIGLPGDRKSAYNSRGKTYFDMAMSGKYPQKAQQYRENAIADYRKGLQQKALKDKDKKELLVNLGTALASKNQFQEALTYLNQGLEIDPDYENGYLNRSLVYFNLRDFERAIKDQTKILEINPSKIEMYYERGMCKRILNRNEEAVTDLNQALQYQPNLGLGYYERGRAKLQMGKTAEAKPDIQKAIQMGIRVEPSIKQAVGL